MNIFIVTFIWALLAAFTGLVFIIARQDLHLAIENKKLRKQEAIQAKRDVASHELRRLQTRLLLEKKVNNRVALAEFDTQLNPLVLCGPCSSLTLGYGKSHLPTECKGYVDIPPTHTNWASYDMTACQCPLCKGASNG